MNKEQDNKQLNNRSNLDDNQEQKNPFRVIYDGNAVKNDREAEQIQVFHRPEIKQKSRKPGFIPFILTILIASAIGIFFGTSLLKLFVVMDEQPAAGGDNTEITAPATSDDMQKGVYEIPELTGYALQAGVFMEKENAEEWLQYYESNNVPIIIWEQDGQYYLFTGIYSTEDAAKTQAEEFKIGGYDIFAKPWGTSGGELNLTEDENEWLHHFAEAWKTSLVTKDSKPLIEAGNSAPATSRLEGLTQKLQAENSGDTEQFYLDILYLYEQLGKDI